MERIFNNGFDTAEKINTANTYTSSINESIKELFGDLSEYTIREVYDMDWHGLESDICEGLKENMCSQNDSFDMLPDYLQDNIREKQTDAACNFGLSFDYVGINMDQYYTDIEETGDSEEEDYFRFQISWGGPSFEYRIYEDKTVVAVYLDWFCGYSKPLDSEIESLIFEWFDMTCMLNFQEKREENM